ncbi:iron-containing alcohol dehydrogenase family protein [Petroclostridium sp. X23]|uniref:iron-containing alcohol dehydrogenase family protein n=1 Tax=Petroclostridium sp. X23 TaxID=3045146 RepID=UPI0024AC98CE|nr:iron-containing alcohol dehydrogenase family protein [Petroclostridium sp. X23]WHH58010.1 iron-containing alcohol dehydrogenase family protein [Petroclostridium sp. X23]
MREGAQIILGSGRYLQNPGVRSVIGWEVKRFYNKVLVVAGYTAWSVTKEAVEKSFEENGIEYTVHMFSGFCSETTVNRIVDEAKDYGVKLLVGIGGGKCMDTVKLAADRLGIRVINMPTSAATCACYATVCIKYDDTGTPDCNEYCQQPVAAVIVDTEIIAKNCPERMLASGIADAMAKFPEIDFSIRFVTGWDITVMPLSALKLAEFNTEKYFNTAIQAIKDVREKKITPAVDDIIFTNLALTGLTSQLSSGSKQLAIAHALYDAVSKLFKSQRAKYLHGEIVSCGILVQLAVNGYSEEYIHKNMQFLKEIGTPISFSELGIAPTAENLDIILDFIFTSINITDQDLQTKIRENFARITK